METKKISTFLSNFLAKTIVLLLIVSITTMASCKTESSQIYVNKNPITTNNYDSKLLTSFYGENVILLPAKDTISKNSINDSIFIIASQILETQSVDEILTAEWIAIDDSVGNSITYSISHMHDSSPNGKEKGNAVEIFIREVPGGFILAGAYKITCDIGNGL
jgi:hypothetical protein